MKSAIVAAMLFAAVPAFAQDQSNVLDSATDAAKFSIDMPIEAIVADPKARAALDTVFPGITQHTMYEQFKSMSLKQLQPMASDQITDAAITKLAAELATIK